MGPPDVWSVRGHAHFSHRLSGEDGGRQSIRLRSLHLLSIAGMPCAKRGIYGAANGRVMLPHIRGSRRDTSHRAPIGTQSRLGHWLCPQGDQSGHLSAQRRWVSRPPQRLRSFRMRTGTPCDGIRRQRTHARCDGVEPLRGVGVRHSRRAYVPKKVV
eukprot:scaffold17489_cov107-Isochrysis_galbana.AAC.2